jgi:acyl-CoA reductase-like NAD-dependent aldehyde dehydrogenase
MNQGQICMSTERIVVDAVADAFVAKLAARAVGLPRRPAQGAGGAGLGGRPETVDRCNA